MEIDQQPSFFIGKQVSSSEKFSVKYLNSV